MTTIQIIVSLATIPLIFIGYWISGRLLDRQARRNPTKEK